MKYLILFIFLFVTLCADAQTTRVPWYEIEAAAGEGYLVRSSSTDGDGQWYQIAEGTRDTVIVWNPLTKRLEFRTKSSLLTGLISLTSLSATAPLQYNNTTGVFSIPLGTSSVDGYLSATDRTNFQTAYTNRITSLTTTGSSGAATLLSNVLNVPNYTLAGLLGVAGYGNGVANQWAYWSDANTVTTSNQLIRDANRVSLGTLLNIKRYSTVGIPAAFGVSDVLYDNTLNTYYGHNGTTKVQMSLPVGSTTQTLRHNGTSWIANSGILSNGLQATVGSGSVNSAIRLDVTANGATEIGMRITNYGINTSTSLLSTVTQTHGASHIVFADWGTSTAGSTININSQFRDTGAQLGIWSNIAFVNKDNTTTTRTGAIVFSNLVNSAYPSLVRTDVLAISGDKVGILTTTPTQKLHVVGNTRITGAIYDSNNDPGTSGQILSSTVTGTDWIAATAGYTGFTPAADSGSGSNVASGGTLTHTGGYGINTSVTGTTVTYKADTSEVATINYVDNELLGLITVDSVFYITSLSDTTSLTSAQMGNHVVVENECGAIYIKGTSWKLVEGGVTVAPVVMDTITSDTSTVYYLSLYIDESDIGGISAGDVLEFIALEYNGVNVLSDTYEITINESGGCDGFDDFYADAVAGLTGAGLTELDSYIDYDCTDGDEYFEMEYYYPGLTSSSTIAITYVLNGDTTTIFEDIGDENWIYEYDQVTRNVILTFDNTADYDTVYYDDVAGVTETLTDTSFTWQVDVGLAKTGTITFVKCGVEYIFKIILDDEGTYSVTQQINTRPVWYVSENIGDDATAEKGNITKPLRNLSTAMQLAAPNVDFIYVLDGAHTASSDTLKAGQVLLADARTVLTFVGRAGQIDSKGTVYLSYIPQSPSDVLNVNADFLSIAGRLTLGGTINARGRTVSFGTNTNTGTAVKNINIIAETVLQTSEIGLYGTTLSNFNYHATANQYTCGGITLGNGSSSAVIDNNKFVINANRFTVVGGKLFFFDIRTGASFANNSIVINANYATSEFPMADYMRLYASNASTSQISLNFKEYRYTGLSLSLMNSASHWDGGGTRITLSGHYISETQPIYLQSTGTLATGFTFENALLEVKQSGVSIISVPTLNASPALRFINSSMKNDGSTAKIAITTATTRAVGDYTDLNSDARIFLDGLVIRATGITQEGYINQTTTSSPLTLSVGDNLINQGGTQATFTFNLPGSPVDGQRCRLVFANQVTACTVAGGTILGASVTTALAGDVFEYKYYTSGTTWVRIR